MWSVAPRGLGGKRRRGVVVIGPGHEPDEGVLCAAAEGKFAGVAVVREAGTSNFSDSIIGLAEKLGIFVAYAETGSREGDHRGD